MASLFSSRFFLSGALTGAALLGCASAASAQNRLSLGLNGGVFFPSSSKTKDVFGSNFKSIGPGFGRIGIFRRRVSPDLDFLREKRGDNRATVVFAGAKVLIPIGKLPVAGASSGFAPYSGVGVNLTYADVDAPDAGIDKHGFGGGASVILGASFGRHFFAEGRYRVSSSAADFNFSGAQLTLGARF